jgi:voltage-gated potassium channel
MKIVDKIIPANARRKAKEGLIAFLSTLKLRVKKEREAACAYSSSLKEHFVTELEGQPDVPAVFSIDGGKKAKVKKSRKYTFSDFWEMINSNNTLIILLIVIGLLCSIAVGAYVFEVGVNEAFKSLWDTLWWTMVTLTTVGYGDKYPVTVGGRILGIFMMVLGVASVGIVTGRIASFLVDKQIKARGGLIVLDRKKGHFVICGWKAELEAILEKILTVDPDLKPTDLVLVNDAEPQEIDHIRSIPKFKTIKFIKGDYIDEKVLGRANVKNAGTVLILADSSKNFSLQEVDSRTVMAAITIDSMNKDVYTCAELIDEKFVKYLKLANCDEIILTREYSRELLANAASASGISHIAAELLNPYKRGLVTVDFQPVFIGKPFKDLQDYFKSSHGNLVIGLLENTGNIYHRKKEALADAQKTPDISKLVENLQSVKKLFPNNPVINPGDGYIIKQNSKAIVVTGDSQGV